MKKKGKRPTKLATNVRVNAFTLTTARQIANKLGIKISDYFNIALQDANHHYEGKTCGKKSSSAA